MAKRGGGRSRSRSPGRAPGAVPGGLPPVDFARYRRYAETVQRHSGEAPLALIVRSLFVADMVRGRLAVDEVPDETLRLIFT